MRARNLAKQWSEAAMQTRDAKRREGALEEIRVALDSTDAARVQAGLWSVVQLHELEFDRSGLRPGILRALESDDAATRRGAMVALRIDPRPDEDVPKLLAMADDEDPAVRAALPNLLRLYGNGKLHGASAEAVVKVLEGADRRTRRTVLSGLWGADADERIVEHCLQLAKDPRTQHDAVYFGLSTFNPKSPAVVKELLAVLEGPDSQTASRASWGLQTGVQEPEHAAVADAYLRMLQHRSSARWRNDSLQKLLRYGSAAQVDGLRKFAAGSTVPPELKDTIDRLIARIRNR